MKKWERVMNATLGVLTLAVWLWFSLDHKALSANAYGLLPSMFVVAGMLISLGCGIISFVEKIWSQTLRVLISYLLGAALACVLISAGGFRFGWAWSTVGDVAFFAVPLSLGFWLMSHAFIPPKMGS